MSSQVRKKKKAIARRPLVESRRGGVKKAKERLTRREFVNSEAQGERSLNTYPRASIGKTERIRSQRTEEESDTIGIGQKTRQGEHDADRSDPNRRDREKRRRRERQGCATRSFDATAIGGKESERKANLVYRIRLKKRQNCRGWQFGGTCSTTSCAGN